MVVILSLAYCRESVIKSLKIVGSVCTVRRRKVCYF